MATPTNDTYIAASGAAVRAGHGAAPGVYAWIPAPGGVAQIGYASGAHPLGLDATRFDASPQGKAWNPTPENVGPWGGGLHPWANHTAFCGFCFAESTQQLITYGGGHATPCVPAPLGYSLAGNRLAWDWLTIPVPSDALSLGATNTLGVPPSSVAALTQVYPSHQYDPEWGEWQGGSSAWGAYARPGEIFPEPGHTDSSIIWVPGDFIGNTNGAIIPLSQASGRWDGGERTISHYFDLDVGQKKWKRLGNKRFNTSTGAGGSIYFGGSVKKLFSLTHGSTQVRTTMDVLDGTTKLWTTRASTNGAPISIYTCGMGAHLQSGLLLSFVQENAGGNPYYPGIAMRAYAVDAATAAAGSHTWARLNITASSWPLNDSGYTDEIGWTYCPRNGCFYATDGRHNSTTLWKLSPPAGASNQAAYLAGTWTVTTETLSSPISNRSNSGGIGVRSYYWVYNRLCWNELAGCFMWPEDYNLAKVQAIRPFGV